jgi:hypothetical protein
MKTRVIQDDPDEPTSNEDRAEAPVEQERSTNLAARMARWAHHRIFRDAPAGDDEAARPLELVSAGDGLSGCPASSTPARASRPWR